MRCQIGRTKPVTENQSIVFVRLCITKNMSKGSRKQLLSSTLIKPQKDYKVATMDIWCSCKSFVVEYQKMQFQKFVFHMSDVNNLPFLRHY